MCARELNPPAFFFLIDSVQSPAGIHPQLKLCENLAKTATGLVFSISAHMPAHTPVQQWQAPNPAGLHAFPRPIHKEDICFHCCFSSSMGSESQRASFAATTGCFTLCSQNPTQTLFPCWKCQTSSFFDFFSLPELSLQAMRHWVWKFQQPL